MKNCFGLVNLEMFIKHSFGNIKLAEISLELRGGACCFPNIFFWKECIEVKFCVLQCLKYTI